MDLVFSCEDVRVVGIVEGDRPIVASIPWRHSLERLFVDKLSLKVSDDVQWRVLWDACGPTSTNTECSIREEDWNDWDIELWLNPLALFLDVVKNGAVFFVV